MGTSFAHSQSKTTTRRRFDYTLEINRQTAKWTTIGKNRLKQPKTQMPDGKVLASVFRDTHGILFINYPEKENIINSENYMALLVHLKGEIAKKRPQMKKNKVIFHQDNAPCHK